VAGVIAITAGVTAIVLVAGLAHATWNAMAKSFSDQWVSFTLINLGVAVPCVVSIFFVGAPRVAAWGYLGAAVVLHIAYQLFLMSAYRHGSLSRSYPIARGVAPLLTTLGGLLFAHEHVGALALAGVALVVLGISSLALSDRGATSRVAVAWALATGVAIATYTVVDGLGVRASHSPLRYTVTLFAIQGTLFVVAAVVRSPQPMGLPARQITVGLSAGVISLAGYGAVLWAQARAPLGVVSALRETGVLWATIFGVIFFSERGGWRVVVAGAVVLGGVIAIALG
jgi:drug/metabolite transporter (DMT)-like permease